jgi:predicted RNA-binding protein with RPS1 domain
MELSPGDRVTGRVIKIMPFGAFVALDSPENADLVGLVKIPEISWQPIHHPEDVLTEGQNVEVEILAFGPVKGQISLSIKRCQKPETSE